jgi:hypothetical protein
MPRTSSSSEQDHYHDAVPSNDEILNSGDCDAEENEQQNDDELETLQLKQKAIERQMLELQERKEKAKRQAKEKQAAKEADSERKRKFDIPRSSPAISLSPPHKRHQQHATKCSEVTRRSAKPSPAPGASIHKGSMPPPSAPNSAPNSAPAASQGKRKDLSMLPAARAPVSRVCPDMLRKDQSRGTSENW